MKIYVMWSAVHKDPTDPALTPFTLIQVVTGTEEQPVDLRPGQARPAVLLSYSELSPFVLSLSMLGNEVVTVPALLSVNTIKEANETPWPVLFVLALFVLGGFALGRIS